MSTRQNLESHDLIYEVPPMEWNQGVPLGNGIIGAMVWGDGHPLHLTLDHPEYFDMRQSPNEHPLNNYQDLLALFKQGKIEELIEISEHLRRNRDGKMFASKKAVGFLDINLPEKLKVKNMRLRLSDATLVITLSTGSQIEVITHAEIPVIFLRCKEMLLNPSDMAIHSGIEVNPDAEKGVSGSVHWETLPIGDGSCGMIAWQMQHEKNDTLIYLTVQHAQKDHPLLENALSVLSEVNSQTRKSLETSHASYWSDFWRKSDITLPDNRLESLWYIELYKLASCSKKGQMPPNLQGLWPPHGQPPPWGGEHANNINTQMNYWPVYTANHLELLEPLHDWLIEDRLPVAKKHTREFYHFDGAKFGTATLGRKGFMEGGWADVKLWPAVGAWWCQHLWWAYLYGKDQRFLRDRAYPFMRECMIFYEQLLEEDESGILHIPLTHSPEWHGGQPRAFCKDSTIDLSLIRYAANAASRAAGILGIGEEKERWTHIVENLAPYPLRTDANHSQWDGGLDIYPGEHLLWSHWHHSHLAPIYPCGDLNIEGSEKDLNLIRKSMKLLVFYGMGCWGGFSFSWAACIVGRLGWGNYAKKMLELYIDAFISPNTFNLNGDYKCQGISILNYALYVNEAGFGAAAAILEMLLQSWNGIIRIFPALPVDWRDVSFRCLRAEGAFLVSAEMTDGVVRKVEIQSEKGGLCRLKNNFSCLMILISGEEKKPCKEKIIEFETVPGGRYQLQPAEPVSDEEKKEPEYRKGSNYFGLKRNSPSIPGPGARIWGDKV